MLRRAICTAAPTHARGGRALAAVAAAALTAAPRHGRAQVIMYAQLRDNSQGIIKITSGAAGRDAAAADIAVERETKLSGAPPAAMQHMHVHCCVLAVRPCANEARMSRDEPKTTRRLLR